MRLYYLSPKKSPKHSLPVIVCHVMTLQQRRMGNRGIFKVGWERWGLLKEMQQLSVIALWICLTLPPTPSGFKISPVNGMFFN
ncbi:hypothetical protein CEXT_220531 [Caerostris extrusa]|uniref:Uncharacterized protein n=1 Tax=Caerostris extrusa TaxID=172846 RepID=A0AAV4NNM8_CAEEX|nr:hypothetical protein CEXT_220531 [Caerostris extrusa]